MLIYLLSFSGTFGVEVLFAITFDMAWILTIEAGKFYISAKVELVHLHCEEHVHCSSATAYSLNNIIVLRNISKLLI